MVLGLGTVEHGGVSVLLLLATDLHGLLFGDHSINLVIVETSTLVSDHA